MRPNEDDRMHLRKAGAGSEAAFLALVDRHHMSLVRIARLWCEDLPRAEDSVQRTWVTLLRTLARFDDQSSLKGWLCSALIRILRIDLGPEHETLFELSAEGAIPAVDPERFSPPGDRWEGHWQRPPVDWADAVPGSAPTPEQRAIIERVIAELPHSQRVVLVLRDVEGLAQREVESALGVSAELQHRLLHLARSRVRSALERHHAEVRTS